MRMTLAQAPVGTSLAVSQIVDSEFASRLSRLGLYQGAKLMRLNKATAIGPAKVRGAKGDAVLSGWLAGQVVIHLDDDRRLPLLECAPGAEGHVEGVSGQAIVEESLRELGIVENDRIEFVRRMPPMNYHVLVNGREHWQLNEGLASHLLGDSASGPAQLSSAGAGEIFTVRRVLAGEDAVEALASMGIVPGSELALEKVSASQELRLSLEGAVACVTKEGVRLYLREQDAAGIYVTAERRPSPQVERLFS